MRAKVNERLSFLSLQRKCACGGKAGQKGECEECRKQRLEQLRVNSKTENQNESEAPPVVNEVLRSSGQVLDPALRMVMEARFGHDFSKVRVHADARAAESAQAVSAQAYTVGSDIVFNAGQYQPDSRMGAKLIAHELTHVVQQGSRRSQTPMASSISAMSDALEEEAAAVSERVAEGGTAQVRGRIESSSRLSRLPLGPGIDILPPIRAAAQTAEALAASCGHPARLTWSEYTGNVPPKSRFSAETKFHYELATAASKQIVKAVFDKGNSWVRAQFANPSDSTLNGCEKSVRKCEGFFDKEASAKRTGGTYKLGPPGPECPASIAPNPSLAASTRADCMAVLGAECNRVAGLESERLLRHEQAHYDLACAIARKGTLALLAASKPNEIQAKVATISKQQTDQYDAQTAHGCNGGQQAAWESEIQSGLPKVTIP